MSALPQDHTVERVTVRSAPEDVLAGLYAVAHEIEREDLPEPPWEPQAEWIAELRGDAGVQDRADWLVRDGNGRPVATASFAAKRSGENRHRAKLVVRVVPEQRRRGVGTHLLRLAADAGLEAGRTVVQTWTSAEGAGAAFADAHGIVAEDDLELNRLRTADLDRELLTTWVDRAPTGAAGYELVAWDGPCPPPLRRGYAAARELMNTAPQTQDHRAETFTEASLDELEGTWEESGIPWWTVAARHVASGGLVGYTELAFSELEPVLAYQGDTAVDSAHRERGVGRWLKAAMLLRALDERPALQVVDTYNAGSNDAMITINRALGFRVVLRSERRRADLAALAASLRA